MANYTGDKDTYISQDNPNTNYDGDDNLYVTDRPTFNRDAQTLIKADISAVSGTISSAKLWVYVVSYSEWTTKNVYAKRITADWVENSVTWNSGNPSTTDTDQATESIANTDTGWQSWDITDIVQGWIDGDYDNYGIKMVCADTGSSSNNESMGMYSSDYNSGSNAPYIEISQSASFIPKIMFF